MSAPPAAAPSAAPKSPAPAPAATADGREISSGAAALLAQGMPAYNPPKPEPAPKPDAADSDDDDDSEDQPRNHIIRLPKMIVHEQQPPIFREKDMYDKDALRRLAMLRYGGLNVGPLSELNGPIADELYREQDRLNNIQNFNDTADSIQAGGDKATADMIRSTTQSTYAQSLGWGDPTPTNPSARSTPGSP